MSISKRSKFILAVAVQLTILLTMIGSKCYTLTCGKTIFLKTAPVDPRSLFRGDYVILEYEISRLDLNEISCDTPNFKKRETIYVSLKKDGKYWKAVRVTKAKESVGKDEVLIKGNVKDWYARELSIEYGIESYFVPEGKGLEIERAVEDSSDVYIEVAVDRFGNSAIKRLFIGTKVIDY